MLGSARELSQLSTAPLNIWSTDVEYTFTEDFLSGMQTVYNIYRD